jgi:hypothetical protein
MGALMILAILFASIGATDRLYCIAEVGYLVWLGLSAVLQVSDIREDGKWFCP